MWLSLWLLSLPMSVFLLWVFYLAVMGLSRALKQDKADKEYALEKGLPLPAPRVTMTTYRIGTAVLTIGYALDFYVNVFVMSILLNECPEELTVTSRLKRHSLSSSKWSQAVVAWFRPLLDPFDPTEKHI